MSATWKRPDSLPKPKVWETFSGRPLPSGQIPRFRIQDITDDLIEPVIQHMVTQYLRDEPFARFLKASKDPKFIEEVRKLWGWSLSYGIGLVCLLDNPEEIKDKTAPIIAGCNITYPTFRDTCPPKSDHPPLAAWVQICWETSNLINCFDAYDVNVILSSFGLSVDPFYRGHRIGEHLFKLREPFCKSLGIKVTNVVFSSPYSKVIGRNLGYDVVGEIRAENFLVDGKAILYGGVDAESMELHVKRVNN